MTTPEVIFCPAQTYRATREQPGEWCETEVANEDDLCDSHDDDARMDDDYDRYMQSKDED